MLSERFLSFAVETTSKNYLKINKTDGTHVTDAHAGNR